MAEKMQPTEGGVDSFESPTLNPLPKPRNEAPVRELSPPHTREASSGAEEVDAVVTRGNRPCVACGEPATTDRCDHCGAAQRAGPYRISRLVAETDYSRVYLAQGADGGEVALKELLFSRVPGREQLDAFEREASVLQSLEHPRIPRFVATFTEGRGAGTRLYLAQEFVAGESLTAAMSRGPLTFDEAITVARDGLTILAALHGRRPPLVHRDVKPANFVRRPDGDLVLVDFGAARVLHGGETHRSTFVGTHGYMPLEQYGGTVDRSSDVYAMGMTLVHLLTGEAPDRLVDPGAPIGAALLARLPPQLHGFLTTACHPKRAHRFVDAQVALKALDAALTGAGRDATMDDAGVIAAATRPWRTARRWLVAMAGVAAFAGLWAGITWATAEPRSPPTTTGDAPAANGFSNDIGEELTGPARRPSAPAPARVDSRSDLDKITGFRGYFPIEKTRTPSAPPRIAKRIEAFQSSNAVEALEEGAPAGCRPVRVQLVEVTTETGGELAHVRLRQTGANKSCRRPPVRVEGFSLSDAWLAAVTPVTRKEGEFVVDVHLRVTDTWFRLNFGDESRSLGWFQIDLATGKVVSGTTTPTSP